jgi:hypothetical protein
MPEYVCTVHVEINIELDVSAANYGLAEAIALAKFKSLDLDEISELIPLVTKIELLT